MAATMKRQRLLHGQKPADIAYKIGVDKRTYERWEEGKTAPQPRNLKDLADQWQIKVTDLRPDLEAEAARLARIEEKLDRLLEAAGLPTDVTAPPEVEADPEAADQAMADEERRLDEPEEEDDATGSEPASG